MQGTTTEPAGCLSHLFQAHEHLRDLRFQCVFPHCTSQFTKVAYGCSLPCSFRISARTTMKISFFVSSASLKRDCLNASSMVKDGKEEKKTCSFFFFFFFSQILKFLSPSSPSSPPPPPPPPPPFLLLLLVVRCSLLGGLLSVSVP